MKKIMLADADWLIKDSENSIVRGSLLTGDGTILAVGTTEEVRKAIAPDDTIETIDCRGCILLPGLVNAHNHVYEITERGLGKDCTMEDWLRKVIYPVNKMLDDEDYYYAAVLASADAFRNGITCIVEQLTNFARYHADTECQAFRDCGMRAAVARGISTQSIIDPEENMTPEDEVKAAKEFLNRWRGEALVKPWLGPAGMYSCDQNTLVRMKEITLDMGVGFHIHLSETRFQTEFARKQGYSGQVDWAYRLGILDEKTSIAHAVWINDAEIELIGSTGASVVHNPSSNQILASGVANVPRWREKGLKIALASDGPASNDSMDMIGEMKSCVLMHRVNTLNPVILSAKDAFKMATEGGGVVYDLGASDRSRVLEAGRPADIACVRVAGNPSMNPVYDPIDALVYYGSGRDVCLTMVNGEIVYREGEFISLDLDRVMKQIKKVEKKVKKLLNIG